jgi:hypothetical protein
MEESVFEDDGSSDFVPDEAPVRFLFDLQTDERP